MVEKLKALISELEVEIDQKAGMILRGQIPPEDYRSQTAMFNGMKAIWLRLKEIEAIDKEAE